MTVQFGEPKQMRTLGLRSATGAVKNLAKFREVLEEEGRAGWELLEKLRPARLAVPARRLA